MKLNHAEQSNMTTSHEGLIVPQLGRQVAIIRHIPTIYGGMSSMFEGKVEGTGEAVMVHENVVEAVRNGTYVPEAERVNGPRKVSTKKERATKHVSEMVRKRLSRGEIIKALAKVLRVTRGTAQTYYYAVK